MGSRGSVIPLFRKLASTGELPITDASMTRFWITLDAGDRVRRRFLRAHGGEARSTFRASRPPRSPTSPGRSALTPPLIDIGIRPGEKLHEEMISEDDARRTRRFDDHYVITPVLAGVDG